jgi:hypothetical protein
MKYYLLVHTHRYGSTAFTFKSERNLNNVPNTEIAAGLDIDLELDRGETLETHEFDLNTIEELK